MATTAIHLVKDLGKCLVYPATPNQNGWYEAVMSLPGHPSSVVRVFKTLSFPANRKGEVTVEDFELLQRHGHIGEGRLQIVDS
jgi:hypothetical protein